MSERTITMKAGETIKIVCASGYTAPKPLAPSLIGTAFDSGADYGGGEKKSKKSKNKTRKNQAGSKRGPNAYMKFAAEVRPQILKEHPELKSDVVKVARKIGEKWRALSAAEKAKY